ncbi:MAG TPA: 2,3-bisphosphoglycerate-independent phosphoglycerate mutase [Tenericutes bacterium]|nr:2,3-bisphosphoglycerate-independent phosphoglycerate mutase [Mycoplasmatota bacterium]
MQPLVLCILDGLGISSKVKGNAFLKANTPNFDKLLKKYPNTILDASGISVGLPENQMGNSEVGHLNIGAGRIVYQPLQLINEKFANKDIYNNKNINSVIEHVKENNSNLHIFGLLSDGGIHSHISHLLGLIDMIKEKKVTKVYYHIFLDGRDTLPDAALSYIDQLENKIKETGIGLISTVSGRYYAMDRDNRWDRIKKAYDAIVLGKGEKHNTAKEAILDNYSKGITDEFIIPAVIEKNGYLNDNDGMIVFNFRPDRLKQLFAAITNEEYECFDRHFRKNLKLVTMMPVSEEVISDYAYELNYLNNTLGEYLSDNEKKQLRIAETEKYAHVTYFFDGGIEKKLEGCTRILIDSPKVATYDLKPEMSAYEVCDKLLSELDKKIYDVIIVNFANCDMVGHTGVMDATIKAVETVDCCLGKIYEKVLGMNGTMIVTADHGNCEYMLDDEDNVITSHSTNKVPFIITNENYKLIEGKLADIAPTILTILGLNIPSEMTGKSLIIK